MTTASVLLKKILGEDYNAVQDPYGSPYVPNPNDAKAYSSQNRSLEIQDQASLAEKIGKIIDSLDEDDITDELADVVEEYLEQVDPNGDMTVEQAAAMLPLPDCQGLYQDLIGYLDDNNIDYCCDNDDDDDNSEDTDIPNEIPADLYPSSSGMVFGHGNARGGSFNLG